MIERRQIVDLWRRGDAAALVTLVRAAGSSYRRPGARLLVARMEFMQGPSAADVLRLRWCGRRRGWCAMARWWSGIQRFLMIWRRSRLGLGCGGVVDLLVEPAGTAECRALVEAMVASLGGETAKVVTWLPGAGGKRLRRLILGAGGEVVFASEGLGAAKVECGRGLEVGREYEGRFVEELRAPQRLVVLGAGDDAKPLVRIASLLGWSVVVADRRVQLALTERFPEAERVVGLAGSVAELGIGSEDAVVLMSHSYEQDRELLAAVLPLAPRYLGVLGARHRSSLLVSEAAAMTGLSGGGVLREAVCSGGAGFGWGWGGGDCAGGDCGGPGLHSGQAGGFAAAVGGGCGGADCAGGCWRAIYRDSVG